MVSCTVLNSKKSQRGNNSIAVRNLIAYNQLNRALLRSQIS